MLPSEELRYLVLATQREGSRTLSNILKPLGLTSAQSEVLHVLRIHEPLSLIELGRLLVCETGSPSRLVNRLVSNGLISQIQSDKDSRKVVLTLTESGKELAEQVNKIESEFNNEISLKINDFPIQKLIDVMWGIVDNTPSGEALKRRKSKKTNM